MPHLSQVGKDEYQRTRDSKNFELEHLYLKQGDYIQIQDDEKKDP